MSKLPSTNELLQLYNIKAKKSLGQNFLIDENIINKIIQFAGNMENTNIIEVGAGVGALTKYLFDLNPIKVWAIEKDCRFPEILNFIADKKGGNLEVLSKDALKYDIGNIPSPKAIIANLPYNIATELLFNWLDISYKNPAEIKSMTLMFQKEVADRIAAAAGSKKYGKLSVMANWLCYVDYGFDIPPTAFVPAPKVYSAVIKLTPRDRPLYDVDRKKLEQILNAAFGQRRKMLRASCKNIISNISDSLENIGIDATRRAETLTIEEFCKMTKLL